MEPTSSKQRVSLVSADRLGSLPDELFRHILTLMPMHDAVKTTILSRRWIKMTYSLPSLIFQYDTFPDVERKGDCFVHFVDQVISRYEGSSIETFDVSFSPKNGYGVHVWDAWITFAIEKNVEQLCLSLPPMKPPGLPSCLFASRSLKKLHLELKNQFLKLPATADLPNLKELFLAFLVLDNDDLKNCFSSFLALETGELKSCDMFRQTLVVSGLKLISFKLHDCYLFHLKNVAVSAPVLKYLDIYRCRNFCGCHINIQTPNLERFVYVANMPQSITLGAMSSVSFARFSPPDPRGQSRNTLCALKFIQSAPDMTCAVLDEWFIENLFPGGYVFLRHMNETSLDCLKEAWLYMWPSKQYLQKTVALLTKCPNLRRLRITISDAEQPEYPSYLKMNMQNLGVLNHLEYAEIINFRFRPSDIEIVEFLLGNAEVLVEANIRAPERRMETRKMASIKDKIVACSKASAKAKILFSEDIKISKGQYEFDEENFGW